jgi:hypothetical protein
VQLPEHTFGLDTKEHPGEWDSWTNEGEHLGALTVHSASSTAVWPHRPAAPRFALLCLASVAWWEWIAPSLACLCADLQRKLADRSSDNKFSIAVGSWVRQRAYPLWAVQELGEGGGGGGWSVCVCGGGGLHGAGDVCVGGCVCVCVCVCVCLRGARPARG